LTRTDPNPRVHRLTHAVLLLAEGHTIVAIAGLFRTAPYRVGRSRILAGATQPDRRAVV
jgi:hypothetical protein